MKYIFIRQDGENELNVNQGSYKITRIFIDFPVKKLIPRLKNDAHYDFEHLIHPLHHKPITTECCQEYNTPGDTSYSTFKRILDH